LFDAPAKLGDATWKLGRNDSIPFASNFSFVVAPVSLLFAFAWHGEFTSIEESMTFSGGVSWTSPPRFGSHRRWQMDGVFNAAAVVCPPRFSL